MRSRKNASQKLTMVLLSIILVLCCTIGGTLAWLQDATDPVTNTFTVGNIDIDLKEHDLTANGTLDENTEVTSEDTYKIIPGTSQPKDPFVRVEANSEACWVFIKVEEMNSAATYITYEIDDAVWTQLTDADGEVVDGVYYHQQAATTADMPLNILKNETVSYSSKLTKNDIDNLFNITTDDAGNVTSMTMKNKDELPKLEFTAYAIQQTNGNGTTFSAAAAWAELNK